MSSTSQEILEAQKLAKQIEKGEHPVPQQHVSGNPAAEQLTTDVPKGYDIPEDATTGGMKPESGKVVETVKQSEPIEAREIAHIVGTSGEHALKEHFVDPTIAAEEKTAVPTSDMTPAEKQTQLTTSQEKTENYNSKVKAGTAENETPAAKQTKLTDKQKGIEHDDGTSDTTSDGTSEGTSSDDEGEEKVVKVEKKETKVKA